MDTLKKQITEEQQKASVIQHQSTASGGHSSSTGLILKRKLNEADDEVCAYKYITCT